VDHDQLVLVHARALLAGPGIAVADADLAVPEKVLGLVPGFLPARRVREAVAGYADAVAAGSLIVVSCWPGWRASCETTADRVLAARTKPGCLAAAMRLASRA
jgi:hypothetical protein